VINLVAMDQQRIVIKFGTSTLTAGSARLSPPRIVELVRQLARLHSNGCEIVLVTSGAIAAGRERLSYPQLPKDIPIKQMLAAVGQPRLMALYEQLFDLYGIKVGQVLITRADLGSRRGYLNSRNTLSALLAQRVLPVINENDTVATEEIRVGDNDNLSALTANLIEADLLIMLTDQPGLLTGDPRHSPDANLIRLVSEPEIPEALWRAAGGSGNSMGTGGMITKLQAADLARRSGAAVVIAPGGEADVILRIAAGEAVGTRFLPAAAAMESRKRYLLAGSKSRHRLIVDVGASQALHNGSSLLAVGLVRVEGNFDRGDIVRVLDEQGRELARGLVNYSAADLSKIFGRHSTEIEAILGYAYGDEVIHRNNLVLL
jgi:glutamate 5-kinase